MGVGVPPTSGAATRVIGGSSTRGESEGVGFFLQDFDLAGGDDWGVSVGKGAVLAGKEELEGEGVEGEP